MTDPRIDRARDAGADKRTLDDLGAIFSDFDTAVGGVDDLGQFGRTDPLILVAKLEQLMERGKRSEWSGIPHHLADKVEHMVRRFHHLVNRNLKLERELEILNMSSNVVVSTPIDNLPPATTSALCTFGAPYSGIDFAICGLLLPAELTPPGRFSTLQFMGIDFATNSISPNVVTYGAAVGTLGVPVVQGMGLSNFYTNLTSPRGPRVFEPWTGWVFDASAKITFAIYNPSVTLANTYLFDWMMRSSPCPQQWTFDPSMVRGHIEYHEGVDGMFDAIHHATIGMSERLNSTGRVGRMIARSGHQLVGGAPRFG